MIKLCFYLITSAAAKAADLFWRIIYFLSVFVKSLSISQVGQRTSADNFKLLPQNPTEHFFKLLE